MQRARKRFSRLQMPPPSSGSDAPGDGQSWSVTSASTAVVSIVDQEHAAGAVGIDGEQVRSGAGDGEALFDRQLAVLERDRAGDAKIDRFARRGGGDGIAERNVADGDAVVLVDERVDGDRQQPTVFERLKTQGSGRALAGGKRECADENRSSRDRRDIGAVSWV